MTKPLPPASLDDIAKWVRDGATEHAAGAGEKLEAIAASIDLNSAQSLLTPVEAALNRARLKTRVRAPKPFRRLRRNQAAVNDSLIEAVHHLSMETQELKQEVNELRRVVGHLRRQLAAAKAPSEQPSPPNSCA